MLICAPVLGFRTLGKKKNNAHGDCPLGFCWAGVGARSSRGDVSPGGACVADVGCYVGHLAIAMVQQDPSGLAGRGQGAEPFSLPDFHLLKNLLKNRFIYPCWF